MADQVVMDSNETDGDTIAAQAYAEMEAEARGEPIPEKKKPDVEAAKPVEEQPAPDASKPSDEVVETVAETEKSEEEIAEENVAKEQKAADDLKAKEEKEATEAKEIDEYAVKHKLTYDEAKEEIVKTKAIIEKYKNDPVEMARALRSTQSGYDKLKAQVEEKPQPKIFQRMSDEQFIQQAKVKFEEDREGIVENFRNKFPAKSEMMTDEAILEDVAERALGSYKQWADGQEGAVRKQAADKRDKVLSEVAEDDKRFIPDVKAILDKTGDAQILHPNFDIEDLLRHSRGEKSRYKAALKAEFDRGVKYAKEGAVIVGAKDISTGGGKSVSRGTSVGWAGSKDQKARALEMFQDTDGYSEEKSYQMFKETFAEELKKDPKFF